MVELGTLSPVEVRDVWPSESGDFTPWLAENADLLSEALGMDLLHERTEAAVGRYSADLVFREVSTDKAVVVENMFAPTDHDHLGKLITYAAGLGASYAVLLSPEFREEHRSALTWLNSVSADDFGFFGVVLEGWRIGESLPAPRLREDRGFHSTTRTTSGLPTNNAGPKPCLGSSEQWEGCGTLSTPLSRSCRIESEKTARGRDSSVLQRDRPPDAVT